MGDLLGKFPEKRASQDKARRKDSCWLMGTLSSRISSRYNYYQSRDPARSVADEDIGPLKGGVIVTVTFP